MKRRELTTLSALEAATVLTAEQRKRIDQTPTADDNSQNPIQNNVVLPPAHQQRSDPS